MAQRLTDSQRRALKQEAAEWDRTSDRELINLFEKGATVRTRLRRPASKSLTIALDEQTLNRLKRAARRRQVEPQTLAALWVSERLSKGQSAYKHPA